MNRLNLFYLLLCIFSKSFSQQAYYNDVNLNLTGLNLKEELARKITVTHANFLSYTPGIWEASRITDEDPNGANNVILLYGWEEGADGDVTNDISRSKNKNGGGNGDWNREHSYPRSLGNPNLGSEGPGSDAHHLRPADVQRNSDRDSRPFADGSGNSGITATGNWYPGDQWKGDVARMMMYMYLRYGDRCLPSVVGVGSNASTPDDMIDLFLEWNAEDPPSRLEINRNNYHNTSDQYAQGNRNPFIDNPNLATQIWGGPNAQDTWNSTPSDTEIPSAPVNLTADLIELQSVNISWTASTDNIEVVRYDIFVDGVYNSSTINTSTKILLPTPNTTYTIQVFAVDLSENISEGSNTINVSTENIEFLLVEDFNDCTAVANNFNVVSEVSDLNWSCNTNAGERNSGAYQMNAFNNGTVPSVDWLITVSPINFENSENEKLSLYTRSEFGNTALQLLYSSDYDGGGNPSNFTWVPVPNVDIPTHPTGNSQSDINEFTNIDISDISGFVYIGFKYDTNGGNATRWTIDNFRIAGENVLSTNDFIINDVNIYPNPSKGTIYITNPSFNKKGKLQIFDILGQLILNSDWPNNNRNTMIMDLPKGILLVKLTIGDASIVKKLIVK